LRSENQPIDDLVADCCEQLFRDYGLIVEPRERHEFPASEELALCGVMGFGGKQMRGALVLASTKELLEHTSPANRDAQRDWICELANQLVGRVKNRLLRRGVEILLATPTALRGDNICPVPTRLRAPQVFAALGGFVCVWIDCELAPGFEIPIAAEEGTEPPVSEGDTLLF
jgi:hypothetical protein